MSEAKDADVDRLTATKELLDRCIQRPNERYAYSRCEVCGTAFWDREEHRFGCKLLEWREALRDQSLSQEAVRDGALEEVAQMAQDRAASEHDDFSEFAHDVRALKREPNAAAQAGQGFSSAPSQEGHAAGPAPAAPDVASMVKRAEQNAQYWLKAGYEEPHRDLAVLNVEQAMNAYKNAMYALLARLGQGWIPPETVIEIDEDGKVHPEGVNLKNLRPGASDE